MTDPEDKGFTIKDRRFFQQSEEEKERLREESRHQEAAREAYESEAKKAAGQLPARRLKGPCRKLRLPRFSCL